MIAFFETFISLFGPMGETFFNSATSSEILGYFSLGVLVILIIKNLIF